MSLADEFARLAEALPDCPTFCCHRDPCRDCAKNAVFWEWCGTHRDEIERALRLVAEMERHPKSRCGAILARLDAKETTL